MWCCAINALLAAHVVYCVLRMRYPDVFTLSARLQDDTQSWDLLLRKGGERKAEWRME